MLDRVLSRVGFVTAFCVFAVLPASADGPQDNVPDNVRRIPPLGSPIPEPVRAELQQGLRELQGSIKEIGEHELLPDVLIYEKAVRWALDHNEIYDNKGQQPAANVKAVLKAGLERARLLSEGKTPWTTATGPVLRGYRSKIDRSVQPYWLVVPKEYDFQASKKHRLDFWWHGRGETLSEANFMAAPPNAQGIIPAPGALIVHPYGRYCNANKFAGEIDTFECLDHAKKQYRIDDKRLVARGFSMGGAACWQFAVHYPTVWAANAPGAGFAETPEFLKVFQREKVEPTWYEKKLWHFYNATDYAENLTNLPTVAYSGEIDSQKQAADVMAREMKKVGLELSHIIGPKTGHSYEKNAKVELNKRIDAIVEKGKTDLLPEVKFVTYTLRYNKCGWLEILQLDKHWERGEVTGTYKAPIFDLKTNGVRALRVHLPPDIGAVIRIDGEKVVDNFPTGAKSVLQFERVTGKWQGLFPVRELEKNPGLQGPIDDAFMDSFINVSPTGRPMNSKTAEWAEKEMKHAADHWRKQFRGDAPMKKDSEITKDDIANNNLVLWGDPMSNSVLAKIADKLPIKWTDRGIQVGDKLYAGGTHVPVLIYPNPLNPKKYVVLNSGFTFREYDQLNNARQVPKLPDYAVIDITIPPNSRYPGKVVQAGFFGERWELLPDDGK